VSFSDIYKSPEVQGIAPPCKNTPVPGLKDVPGAVDPKTTTCLMPPRPMLACKSSDGTAKKQTCKDEGPLSLDRSRAVDEEISAKVIDFLDRNDPKKTNKPFFVWYTLEKEKPTWPALPHQCLKSSSPVSHAPRPSLADGGMCRS
jgi:arylsulfatase